MRYKPSGAPVKAIPRHNTNDAVADADSVNSGGRAETPDPESSKLWSDDEDYGRDAWSYTPSATRDNFQQVATNFAPTRDAPRVDTEPICEILNDSKIVRAFSSGDGLVIYAANSAALRRAKALLDCFVKVSVEFILPTVTESGSIPHVDDEGNDNLSIGDLSDDIIDSR